MAAALLLFLLLLGSCTLEDPRDLCCPYSSAMRYTYNPFGSELFPRYIHSLHHYLYDEDGNFIGLLPPGENLQYQPLDLKPAVYTMVTIGNVSGITSLRHPYCDHISDFSLHAESYHPADADFRGNSDELYWGAKSFRISEDGTAEPLSRRLRETWTDDPQYEAAMVTEMNNIHCHLRVRVEWAGLPPHIGTYEMELDSVATSYSLHPERALNPGGFMVPEITAMRAHRLSIPLRSQELNGEFVTLRLSDADMPKLRILYGEEQVSPDIDLGKAFRTWGWRPDRTHVQKYSILLRVNTDGSASLFPTIEGIIEDWIDGGTFG